MKGTFVVFVPRVATRRLMLLACLTALASMTAFADNISFSGSGDNGTLAPGVPFSYDSFGSVPEGNWGIPGVGDGDVPWPGSVTISEFDITFALPSGTAIDPAEVAIGSGDDCRGNSAGGTTFCVGSSSAPWRAVVIGTDSIEFFASPGNAVTPGDNFFVDVFFNGPDPSGAAFSGSWTISSVPEPGTIILFCLGFAGLALLKRISIYQRS
jgi:PEP-CTERM motif